MIAKDGGSMKDCFHVLLPLLISKQHCKILGQSVSTHNCGR